MSIKNLIQSQKGDTIVEVLIAIAVMTSVLGGAFVMTNRSLQDTRTAQERVNAVKLVESQIELVKNVVATNPDSLFGAGVPAAYCINSSGTVLSSTNAACKVDGSGAATTTQPAFNLAITRSGNTFTATNSWTSIRGGGNNTVQMKYRAYEN
jgi:type II secretory pathway pseudopilin PulG